MTHVLISFLGRGRYDRSTGKRQEYAHLRYEFLDDRQGTSWISPPSKHFAHAAFERCRSVAGGKPFDRVVILGTAGSMWDTLAESFGASGNGDGSDTLWRLVELVDREEVNQVTLDRYTSELTSGSTLELKLTVIPIGIDTAGQAEILAQIDTGVAEGDSVWMDVTHSFRHLPIIGLAAANLITSHKQASIEEIVYGAWEMTRDGRTPVVSLRWMLDLLKTIGGTNELSRRQNLRPLIECFPNGSVRNGLEDVAYKLEVMRIDEAAAAARACIKQLDDSGALPAHLALIVGVLRDRLSRFTHQSRTLKGLTQMARLALDQDDFLRASIYLAEAITLAEAKEIAGDPTEDRRVKAVRNWLAHAGRLNVAKEDRDVRQSVKNRNELRQFLRVQIDRLWCEAGNAAS